MSMLAGVADDMGGSVVADHDVEQPVAFPESLMKPVKKPVDTHVSREQTPWPCYTLTRPTGL